MSTRYYESGYAFAKDGDSVSIRHKASVIAFTDAEFRSFVADLTYWLSEVYYGDESIFPTEEARQKHAEAVKSAPNMAMLKLPRRVEALSAIGAGHEGGYPQTDYCFGANDMYKYIERQLQQ